MPAVVFFMVFGSVEKARFLLSTSRSTRRCPGSNVSLCMANSFWKGFLLNQPPPHRPCLGPPDPGLGGLDLTKLTTGKEHYTSCTLKVAWKWLTMAPDAHGAQVLPDPDFGPKNMIRHPPLKQTFPTTFVSCTWKKNENRKNFGQLFN